MVYARDTCTTSTRVLLMDTRGFQPLIRWTQFFFFFFLKSQQKPSYNPYQALVLSVNLGILFFFSAFTRIWRFQIKIPLKVVLHMVTHIECCIFAYGLNPSFASSAHFILLDWMSAIGYLGFSIHGFLLAWSLGVSTISIWLAIILVPKGKGTTHYT